MNSQFSGDPRRWHVFGASWLAYVGFYFCRKPFSVAKGTIGTELHLDASSLGTIGAAYLIAYAAGQFLAGTLGDRLGARRLLLLGMVLSIVSTVAFALDGVSIVWMFVNGLGQAVGWPAGVALMAAWFGHTERGRVMGVWATNFQVGSLLATFAASAVLVRWGWRASFYLGAVVLSVVWLSNVFFLHDPEDVRGDARAAVDPHDETIAASGWSVDLAIDVGLIGVFYFFLKFIRYALWSWVPFFLHNKYGLASDQAGYYSTLFDVAGIPGVMVTGWMSDRWFGGRRAAASFVMMLMLFAGCGVLMSFGAGSFHVFVASLAVVGFSLYGPDALMTGAGAMDLGDRGMALRITGIIVACGACGPIVQEVLIGRLYDSGGGDLSTVFALLFGSAALSATALSIRMWRETG